jgi:hypothetical protein
MGREYKTIPWEKSAPIVVTGFINSTLPNPPVIIGEGTKIFLEKYPNDKLTLLQQNKVKYKEARVDILEQQIKMNTIDLINEIKHQNYPFLGQKYQFKATNPQKLFSSILKLFEGLNVIEKKNEEMFDGKEQDYLGTAVFSLRKQQDDLQLIDVQVSANKYIGALLLWVTGKNEEHILETLNQYDAKITQLKEELEQKVEVLSVQCPECGGSLPIREISIDGIVECSYCGKISKIPKALRY